MPVHPAVPQTQRAVLCDRALYALLSHNSDGLIHGVLEFDGRLDAAILARAVRASLDAEPILGCRLVVGPWRMVWQRRADLDQAPLFSAQETADPEVAVEAFLVEPASAEHDPLVRVRLVRGPGGDRLCVKVQHIVADARAVKEYLYALADLYRRLTAEPDYRPPVRPGSRSLRQILARFGRSDWPGILRRAWRNQRSLYVPPLNWRLPLRPVASPRFLLVRRVDPITFARLRNQASRCNATLNDLAVTAVFRALTRLAEVPAGAPRRLIGTVDLRRYLPDGQVGATCNLSAFCYLNLGKEIGHDFAETLQRVRAEMNRLKGDYLGVGEVPGWVLPLMLPPWLSQGLVRWLFPPDSPRLPPAMTNMGALDAERLAFGDRRPAHAWMAAPLMFAPLLGIGLSGYQDGLSFVIGSCGPGENRALLGRLLDLILAELTTAAAEG